MGWWWVSLTTYLLRLCSGWEALSPHLFLQISFCVYTILGVVKRARWPADTEEAKAGGFLVGYTPSGNPIYRNPCTEQVLKLFDNLLALIRWVKLTWNHLCWPKNLWKPNCDNAQSMFSQWSQREHRLVQMPKYCSWLFTVGNGTGQTEAFWMFVGLAYRRPSKPMGAWAGVVSSASTAINLPPS